MIPAPLDLDGVHAVLTIGDPVLRNLWITQCYAELGQRMERVVGSGDLTWCRFAVWASGTAGQSIRGEELPHVVVERLAEEPDHHVDVAVADHRLRALRTLRLDVRLDTSTLVAAVRGALADVSAHLAHGNTLVFAELAPLFVTFLARCEADSAATVTAQELADLLQCSAGAPVEPDVAAAFEWWRRAAVATDERERAFAVLAANVLAVSHEQRRLQADIVAAMDAGVVTATEIVGAALPAWTPRPLDALIARLLGAPLRRIADRVAQELVTSMLMTLHVPGGVLRLHHDVPPLADGTRWPALLAELADHPELLAEAVAVYRRWDRTGGTGLHDGARDWASLTQRMTYIVNLFRSRQRDRTLAAQPFSPDQLAVMRAGAIPPGPLLPASAR